MGCEYHMQRRAVSPELGNAIVETVAKAARYYTIMGHGSFSPGNADGGLTTLNICQTSSSANLSLYCTAPCH